MTVKIVRGDLLLAKEDLLVHQVNCMAKMNSGVARAIREKYPIVYEKYMDYCKGKEAHSLLGHVQPVEVDSGKYVLNLFGQKSYGYDKKRYTSYDALWNGLEHIKNVAKREGLSVALPHGIGSVRGGASWAVVYAMIEDIFKDYEITIYKLEE